MEGERGREGVSRLCGLLICPPAGGSSAVRAVSHVVLVLFSRLPTWLTVPFALLVAQMRSLSWS